MGSVHNFEDRAVARLRARLGAAEEANQDLIAFARGHHGTVSAIHRAVLAVMESPHLAALTETVTHHWPAVLNIDHCALAFPNEPGAVHATRDSVAALDPVILSRAAAALPAVTVRDVARGHPLFGTNCTAIRAEALVRIDLASGERGLLLLGQCRSPGLADCGGNELLRFLGQSLAAMIGRWRTGADS